MKMSITTHESGFSMTFANGLTLSVAHGKGAYCDNKDGSLSRSRNIKSRTAEIAISDEDDNWLKFGLGTVEGWVSADKIAIWINRVRAAESLDQLERDMNKEDE